MSRPSQGETGGVGSIYSARLSERHTPSAKCAKTPAGRAYVKRMQASRDVHKDVPVKAKPTRK